MFVRRIVSRASTRLTLRRESRVFRYSSKVDGICCANDENRRFSSGQAINYFNRR